MTAGIPVTTLVVGPSQHGVVRHALRTAASVAAPVRRYSSVDGCPDITIDSMGSAVHVHYTDRLFGDDAHTAASTFDKIFGRFSGRLFVSLHDVPFPDGGAHASRRAIAYRRVIALADTVVVASDAEAQRVRILDPACRVRVVRLPIRTQTDEIGEPVERAASELRTAIGIIGFIYPGKGHAHAIEAAAALSARPRIVAAGTVSAGHEPLLQDLFDLAERRGVAFETTGYVSDRCMDRLARDVAVPVVASTNTSASASLNTWLEAGRRPLVAITEYTVEFERRSPGSIVLYDSADPDGLTTAIRVALDDPSSTRCQVTIARELSPEATAAALLDVYGVGR